MPALVDAVLARGEISFAEYMQIALYDPEAGYYARNAPGLRGTFRTSPTITPWFGKLLSGLLAESWTACGSPRDFCVVEPGGGTGSLAKSVFDSASGDFAAAARWHLVERAPAIRRVQQENLEGLPVDWSDDLRQVSVACGFLIANEVLDNFPVRLFEKGEFEDKEIFVGMEAGRLTEVLRTVPDPEPEMRRASEVLEPGDRYEIAVGVEDWVHDAAGSIDRGHLAILDYGDVEPGLWTSRPTGSLVTYSAEEIGTDVYANPGALDLTAHVNFTRLEEAAMGSGFESLVITDQRALLGALGAFDELSQLRSAGREAERAGDHPGMLSLLAERGRLHAIIARRGLGDLKVLLASKNAPRLEVQGA